MKKIYTLLFVLLVLNTFGQMPQSFKYQAILRDSEGKIIPEKEIELDIKIIRGMDESVVFEETHSTVTTSQGLVCVNIGNGEEVVGSIGTIGWSSSPFFIQTTVTIVSSGESITAANSPILSVPYALYARSSGSVVGDGSTNNALISEIELNGNQIVVDQNGTITSIDLSPMFENYVSVEYLNNHNLDVEDRIKALENNESNFSYFSFIANDSRLKLMSLTDELSATQTGAGLSGDGNYLVNSSSSYLGTSTSLADADNKLDAQVKINADAISSLSSASSSATTALSTELDATQTGAGLGANGTYTANSSSSYLTGATTLVDADNKLDAQIKANAEDISAEETARINKDNALSAELDATQAGAGLAANGAYIVNSSSNYLTGASSLLDADNKIDAQLKLNSDAISSLSSSSSSATTALSTELDATQTGAGLGANGTYTANSSSNYLTSATSLMDADNKIDAQLKVNADAISSLSSASSSATTALSTELDATQAGAGLAANGSYTANSSSNYLTGATSLMDADNKLDAQVKANANAISAEETARINADNAIQASITALNNDTPTSEGTAEAGKSLVVDSNKNIQGLNAVSSNYFYFGGDPANPADGDWRMTQGASGLEFQRYDGASWELKMRINN